MPAEKWINKLKEYKSLAITPDGKWKAVHRKYLINNDDLEIISIYNSQIRGMYNFYKLAHNVHTLNDFYYFMKYSFLRTLGAKYKSSVASIYNQFSFDGKLGIKYETKVGTKIRYFYHEGFKRVKIIEDAECDTLPSSIKYFGRTSLIERLNAEKCEYCGKSNIALEMHHVRKLKDLKGKSLWEQHMLARKRKTLALCVNCHRDLHTGKLN